MKTRTLLAASAAVSLLSAAPAMATITITEGNVAGNLYTVHLTDDVANDQYVNGWVAANDILVLFTGDETIAPTGGQGQAWVGGVDDSTDYLKFEVVGHTFDALEFNLNTANGGKPLAWGVTITGVDQNNQVYSHDFTGITNNEFFNLGIVAGSGEHIQNMSFHIDGGTTESSPIVAAGQFRVGGISGVPEAATWMLMIAGFGGAGAMLRRRRGALA
jgi:hypothetical protein